MAMARRLSVSSHLALGEHGLFYLLDTHAGPASRWDGLGGGGSTRSRPLLLPNGVLPASALAPAAARCVCPAVMKVTEQQMKDARIDVAFRDYCAHLLIPLNACRHTSYYLPWKCSDERHAYEKCQYFE